MSLGMVAQLPDKDETSIFRKQIVTRLDVCMGGRFTEELIFGENEVTSGASSDLQQATNLARARAMVTKYGVSKVVGVVTHNYDDNGKSMSTGTRLLIEKEARNFLDRAYNNAKTILTTHIKELHALANACLSMIHFHEIRSRLSACPSHLSAAAATSADSCTTKQFAIKPGASSINSQPGGISCYYGSGGCYCCSKSQGIALVGS